MYGDGVFAAAVLDVLLEFRLQVDHVTALVHLEIVTVDDTACTSTIEDLIGREVFHRIVVIAAGHVLRCFCRTMDNIHTLGVQHAFLIHVCVRRTATGGACIWILIELCAQHDRIDEELADTRLNHVEDIAVALQDLLRGADVIRTDVLAFLDTHGVIDE